MLIVIPGGHLKAQIGWRVVCGAGSATGLAATKLEMRVAQMKVSLANCIVYFRAGLTLWKTTMVSFKVLLY